jgi:hypothetical protein
LWFNLYPNAFKSDRTAFSEYLLNKRRTDFYFSEQSKRGYINRLIFRTGAQVLETEDHPQYIDVIKVVLEKPLAPGVAVEITTPFHVKVPHNFDGIGHYKGEYNLRYWYPAIAESVQPLTNKDSSSNMYADYAVEFKLPARLAKNTSAKSETRVNDSVTLLHFTGSRLKDFPVVLNARQHTKANVKRRSIGDSLSGMIGNLFKNRFLPAPGYNKYDGFQLGILAHNLHTDKSYKYYAAPLYAFNSKSFTGIAGISYTVQPARFVRELEIGVTGSTFSINSGIDSSGSKVFAKLFKVVPFARATLPSRTHDIEKTLTFKTYIINERDLDFVRYSVDSLFYPVEDEYSTRFVNELTFDYSSKRVLYPYHAQLQIQQALTFYRINATGRYFFNYPKGGGANVRVFAAKFGYIGDLTSTEKFSTSRYQPKLTAVRGEEDYTYSNYFLGRNESDGLAGRQIMMRDGALKIRTDLFSGLQGRSDNWIAAINLNTSIPKIFPVDVPLKLFFDAGTHAGAWDEENQGSRFMYVAGLQLSLFKNVLNVYAPVLYSKQIRDQLKTVENGSSFGKTISFSIDVQALRRETADGRRER